MQRREFLAHSAALSAASALWAVLHSAAATGAERQPPDDPLFERVCDLVIPDTDTPGAKAVGVPRFMTLAIAHGLAGSSPADRPALELLLHEAADGDFLRLTPARQHEVLTAVDQAGFATRGSLWPRIKSLVLMGYYTSDVGCTQELYYQLVPGRFDPDVPLKPGDRASANDWTGQRFG